MPKYYVSSNTLRIIVSCRDALEAAVYGFKQTNKHDILDEHFYVDERGYRDYVSADPKTNVIATRNVVQSMGAELLDDDE